MITIALRKIRTQVDEADGNITEQLEDKGKGD
jgi:hypothetical protein